MHHGLQKISMCFAQLHGVSNEVSVCRSVAMEVWFNTVQNDPPKHHNKHWEGLLLPLTGMSTIRRFAKACSTIQERNLQPMIQWWSKSCLWNPALLSLQWKQERRYVFYMKNCCSSLFTTFMLIFVWNTEKHHVLWNEFRCWREQWIWLPDMPPRRQHSALSNSRTEREA